jgi:hypothetical protein
MQAVTTKSDDSANTLCGKPILSIFLDIKDVNVHIQCIINENCSIIIIVFA